MSVAEECEDTCIVRSPDCVLDASVRVPCATERSVGIPSASVKVLYVAASPAWDLEASALRCSRSDDLMSWRLCRPNSEVVTGGVKKTLKRRTWPKD